MLDSRCLLLATLIALTGLLPAQDGRKVVNAEWAGEKVTVTYGTPNWNPGFLKAIEPGLVWRLGNNDPTRLTTRCALMADEGIVSPGEYGLAMRAEKGGGWSLVIYDGKGQFNESYPAKTVGAHPSVRNATTEALEIALGQDGALHVTFGPLRADFRITPVKVTRYDTRFASVDTEVQIANMPLGETAPKDLSVGNVIVTVPSRMMGDGGDAMELRYALNLDMSGEAPRLAFSNGRKEEIPAEVKAAESRIGRIKSFVERNPAMKERGEAAIKQTTERIAALRREAAVLERFTPSVTIDGKATSRETATQSLTLATERPEGLLVLIFGAGGRDARFEVDPQKFFQRRRR